MENVNEISRLVASLPTMDRPQLVAQWKEQFGNPPHPKLRIELMRPVLAYRIQESAAGHSTRSTRWRLQDHSPSAQTARFKAGRFRFNGDASIGMNLRSSLCRLILSKFPSVPEK